MGEGHGDHEDRDGGHGMESLSRRDLHLAVEVLVGRLRQLVEKGWKSSQQMDLRMEWNPRHEYAGRSLDCRLRRKGDWKSCSQGKIGNPREGWVAG